jgi:GNAT superfamily N-acetyltransferase
MPSPDVHICPAREADLEGINRVIEAAVMTWHLPERVKRLSLPGYRYSSLDLEHLEIVIAEDDRQHTLGVAAWEPAEDGDAPAGKKALLLHGIYVDPPQHHRGIGRLLFSAAEHAVRNQDCDGLLVRAQQGANGFFIAQGMERLHVDSPARQYANRFWKSRTAILETSEKTPS